MHKAPPAALCGAGGAHIPSPPGTPGSVQPQNQTSAFSVAANCLPWGHLSAAGTAKPSLGACKHPLGVIPCTIREMGTHQWCWSWQGRAGHFFSPSCLQKEKGSGGRAASPRHTQGTQRCAERDSTRRAAGTGRARRHPAPRARQHRPAPCQRGPGALSKVCGTQGTRVALLRAARGQAGAPAALPGPVRDG